jgi:hypothetical protein
MSDEYEYVASHAWCEKCEQVTSRSDVPQDHRGHKLTSLYREKPKTCGHQLTHLGHVVATCSMDPDKHLPQGIHKDEGRRVWWKS